MPNLLLLKVISVDLFESVQGMYVMMISVEGSDNTLQIHRPPRFVFNLHQRGLTSKQVVTDTRTISFGCGCALGITHEKSGSPTIATFPPPGGAKRPFTPSFSNTCSTGLCKANDA